MRGEQERSERCFGDWKIPTFAQNDVQLQDISRAGLEEGKGREVGVCGVGGLTKATGERGCWMDEDFEEKGKEGPEEGKAR